MLGYEVVANTGVNTSWWRHQMETFSALLAICTGNSPVSGECPSQRPVTRSFDIYFDLRLNKRLCKQSWGWWLETLLIPLWRHSNLIRSFNYGIALTWTGHSITLLWRYHILIFFIASIIMVLEHFREHWPHLTSIYLRFLSTNLPISNMHTYLWAAITERSNGYQNADEHTLEKGRIEPVSYIMNAFILLQNNRMLCLSAGLWMSSFLSVLVNCSSGCREFFNNVVKTSLLVHK